jgi:hypothetical protein
MVSCDGTNGNLPRRKSARIEVSEVATNRINTAARPAAGPGALERAVANLDGLVIPSIQSLKICTNLLQQDCLPDSDVVVWASKLLLEDRYACIGGVVR